METNIQNNKLELLGKLAATLSHEIRNPLSVLKLNLHYLKTYIENLNEENVELITTCEISLDRITNLVENILEFSRRPVDDLEVISLKEIIDQALIVLNPIIMRQSISIIKEFEENTNPLRLNRNKILQVVLNLLSNAIEASTRGSKIILCTYRIEMNGSSYVIVEFQDFGVGISDSDKEKIFQEFFTKKVQGTGLGLSVCKTILKEFNAEIYFESMLGSGTKFFLKFPLDDNR
ncbi:MAG: HAMP domain-containing sensor histidine kinase [Ignavibacteriales bacterium]|nr:HAMP domain-containing sensor histidine kinase [Ignavibacteriales bacterium]